VEDLRPSGIAEPNKVECDNIIIITKLDDVE
jgi:hypothetical protein